MIKNKGIIGIILAVIIFAVFIVYDQTNYFKKKPFDKDSTGSIIQIKKEQYSRYILAKNTTESYILQSIKEYGELSGNTDYKMYRFDIANTENWLIIKVGDSVSFYDYHNITNWLLGFEEKANLPKISVGFAQNKDSPNEDYFFYLDPENEYGDTQVGVFKNGKTFFIYLPEAYEEYGNLKVTDDFIVSMKENVDFLMKEGFDISTLHTLGFSEHQIRMNQ